ncbi:MEDS domain-containing protein [Mucilaginibacter sp.]|jgi:hypothetical protein|uniref:MEDS domain-containing protein n=1 Tax=Mucilaginibacter sp. TaxID=1882438 RepID=UPI0035617F30
MTQALRPTGIDVIRDLPWDTHFCHFYETKHDLLPVPVPYFKAGLQNNEYCIWITSGIQQLRKRWPAVPNLDQHF